jgi:hypothetical protein
MSKLRCGVRAMSRNSPIFVLLAALTVTSLGGPAFADLVCPDSSYVTVQFTNPARNRIGIIPNGLGQTFAQAGITIRVFLRNCSGVPIVGVPADEVILYNSQLCICPGGNIADADSDANGSTTFSATLEAGGCVESLDAYADGVRIQSIPVKTFSPDFAPISPCFVDASDLAHLATRLGVVARYTICADMNQSGPPTIDSSDLAWYASFVGSQCQ